RCSGAGRRRRAAAFVLAGRGAAVVGADASSEMLQVARARAAAAAVTATFLPGDVHALPFPDRSFDASVCLRVIMHTPDWVQAVSELCRVSRWRVVVDCPALSSFAALESGVRRIARSAGRKTEAYRVFAERRVSRTL